MSDWVPESHKVGSATTADESMSARRRIFEGLKAESSTDGSVSPALSGFAGRPRGTSGSSTTLAPAPAPAGRVGSAPSSATQNASTSAPSAPPSRIRDISDITDADLEEFLGHSRKLNEAERLVAAKRCFEKLQADGRLAYSAPSSAFASASQQQQGAVSGPRLVINPAPAPAPAPSAATSQQQQPALRQASAPAASLASTSNSLGPAKALSKMHSDTDLHHTDPAPLRSAMKGTSVSSSALMGSPAPTQASGSGASAGPARPFGFRATIPEEPAARSAKSVGFSVTAPKEGDDKKGSNLMFMKDAKLHASTPNLHNLAASPMERGRSMTTASKPGLSAPGPAIQRSRSVSPPRKSDNGTTSCSVCEKPVFKMEEVRVDDFTVHKWCFRCAECGTRVTPGSYASLQGKIFCKPHFKQLFKLKGNYDEGFGGVQHKNKWLHVDV